MKAKRTGKQDNLPELVAFAFSWTLAMGRYLEIDIEEEFFKRYPWCCPYDGGCPCECHNLSERPKGRIPYDVLRTMHPRKKPRTLVGIQAMMKRIYPRNTFADSVEHLGEEAFELGEAVENYDGFPFDPYFEKIVDELIDVVANLIAVANSADSRIVLTKIMVMKFRNGCPRCEEKRRREGLEGEKCVCGFTVAFEGHVHSISIRDLVP
jgi:NTP pyrophosphatase (non-canonical NTP hydrolase)